MMFVLIYTINIFVALYYKCPQFNMFLKSCYTALKRSFSTETLFEKHYKAVPTLYCTKDQAGDWIPRILQHYIVATTYFLQK